MMVVVVVAAIVEIFFFLSIKMVLLWVLILGMGFDVAMSFDFTMASFDYGLIYGSLILLER